MDSFAGNFSEILHWLPHKRPLGPIALRINLCKALERRQIVTRSRAGFTKNASGRDARAAEQLVILILVPVIQKSKDTRQIGAFNKSPVNQVKRWQAWTAHESATLGCGDQIRHAGTPHLLQRLAAFVLRAL